MNNTHTLYSTLRTIARNRLLDILGIFSTPAPGIHLLNGHRIENECEPNTFRALLQDLSEYATFIKVEEAVQMICNHETPNKPLVAFTFDDGFMECYDIFAPVLEEFGTNALFFINPNYVDEDEEYIENFNKNIVMTHGRRPMRWQHIEELNNKGHIIGAHTLDHYMINTNDTEVLRHQIIDCQNIRPRQPWNTVQDPHRTTF